MLTSLITTGIGLATTYGAGVANTVVGTGSTHILKSPMRLRGAEIERLGKISRCLTAHISLYQNNQNSKASPIKEATLLPTVEDDGDGLPSHSSCLFSNIDPNESESATWIDSINKEAASGSAVAKKVFSSPSSELNYRITLEKYKDLVDKRLKYERTMQKIDQGSKLSSISQSAMGAGQIAEATSAIGNATLAVTVTALGFSILSSFFYLCTSLYGVISFSKQLSTNRQQQADIKSQMEKIRDATEAETNPAQLQLAAFELSHFEKELATLENEENLLLQSRNSHLIHLAAAAMGLTATILFILGTHGFGVIAYYILTAGSGILPLAAMAYSRFSTNPKKHQQEQAKIVMRPDAPLPKSKDLAQGYAPYSVQDTLIRKLQLNSELEGLSTTLFGQVLNNQSNNPFHDGEIEDHLENLLLFIKELNEQLLEKDLESRKYATGTEITEFYDSSIPSTQLIFDKTMISERPRS